MAINRAAGTPSLSGNYIPEIWSGKLLSKFYKTTVFSEIANTEYEGEITKKGDKVYIRTVPDIQVRSYEIGQNLQYDTHDPEFVTLTIDYGEYYGFKINDVEKAQSDINYMERWSDDASQQMKIAIDQRILEDVYDDVDSSNTGASAGAISGDINLGVSGTPVEVSESNVIQTILLCGQVLDEQNIPETDRWMVIPSWMATRIKDSDLKNASMMGDSTSPIRNGKIGGIDRFTLYQSNSINFANDSSYGDNVWDVIFGHKSALTFASQLTKNEMLKNPYDFGDLIRGLQVYGYEVIKPESMGRLYAAPAALT